MPQKSWAVGEEVLAADFQTYAQNQVVPQFTGTAQRDSQWAAPPNGALCVTVDTNTLWQRVAGAWAAANGTAVVAQNVWKGTAPAAGVPLITKVGTVTVTTDSGGSANMAIPAPNYVTGIITVHATVGDSVGTVYAVTPGVTASTLVLLNLFFPAGASVTRRVNYYMIGA